MLVSRAVATCGALLKLSPSLQKDRAVGFCSLKATHPKREMLCVFLHSRHSSMQSCYLSCCETGFVQPSVT